MPEQTPKQARIVVRDLEPRDSRLTDEQLDATLKRLGASAGAPCELDCECRIGLVCRKGICTDDW